MSKLLTVGAVWCVWSAVLCAEPAAAPPPQPAPPSDFTRFQEDATGARLQTGIGSYRNKQGVTVDLIGAIHIADRAYYEKLNLRFTRYDAVLYELVGESFAKRQEWTEAKKRGESLDGDDDYVAEKSATESLAWLHSMYEQMETSLALTGQLSVVDYLRPNFVHADMSARVFAAMQEEKKESFFSLYVKMISGQWEHPESQPQSPGLLQILEVLCSKDSSTEMKRLLGRMFGSIEGTLAGLDSDNGTVILTERNRVALEVLREQILLGKKRLAIFYGAAHLPNMEKQLCRMGFEPVGKEWFTAWNLPPAPPKLVRKTTVARPAPAASAPLVPAVSTAPAPAKAQ